MSIDLHSSNFASSNSVLIISDDRAIQETLRRFNDLLTTFLEAINDPSAPAAVQGEVSTAPPQTLNFAFADSGDAAVALVEAAGRAGLPFAVVLIDYRLFLGGDHTQVNLRIGLGQCSLTVKRLWQAQADLQFILHSVCHEPSLEQISGAFDNSPRLVALTHVLLPSEITQLAQMSVAKWQSERRSVPSLPSSQSQNGDGCQLTEDKGDSTRKSQRLEMLGCLVDGVAHDFNNFLTVMQGHLSIALGEKGGGPKLVPSLEAMLQEAKSASAMTRQLVAFNHREYLDPKAICLESSVDDEVAMLRRVLGEQTTIEVDHEPDLPPVMADLACLSQILVSLALHGRDAMPHGGKLAIHTRRTHIPNVMAAGLIHVDARPGDFVVLALTDAGRGLSTEEQTKLFDPSFANLQPGRSSGMGLVVAEGLVRHQGGWINVTSVPEVGTEFSVYLPAADGPLPYAAKCSVVDIISSSEPSTILVVDDEKSVRDVMEYVLTTQGHKVLAAKDANEGWTMWRERSSVIKLAIIDIKLPGGVSGFDLDQAITHEDPTLPVVFTCGYCPTTLDRSKELKTGINYLPKPFGMVELLNVVSQALLKPVRF